MVSKNEIKIITSLQQKKYRSLHGLFVAEGPKVITELLQANFTPEKIYATATDLFANHLDLLQIITDTQLKKISSLKTPNRCLALFRIPEMIPQEDEGLTVVLDDVRDPGNLGTIIRLCDWFGVHQLVCSVNTVDCYNPKVVQATMGSLARVAVIYSELSTYLERTKRPVFGAFMDGDNVYRTTLPTAANLVMGNEANGISTKIAALIDKRIAIPRFGSVQKTESLNVATATGILLSEFRRSN
ncbi:TrmH family RNA methyltransferase [Sungkyunkwania multivorans]|uniref:TrmH family RNA methyltransferase n=1 Tax=Sungkyunkwania multivorans TaxID=1173618 RepID=A0ABW3CYV7_9FLAO